MEILFRLPSVILKSLILFFLITFAWVAGYSFINPPITPLMVIRYFQSDAEDKSIKKIWRDYEDISENLALAIIASEDQKFFDHEGFDMEAIEKAMDRNKRSRKIKGASTISQQVAKNVFLWPSRSWVRKGFETYFTFLIETMWSKKRILEVYMNVAEMGDGIYGAERASRAYFRKPAKYLSREEAALITAALPSPKRMSPASPSTYLYSRQRWILWQMGHLGSIELLSQGKY